MGGCGERQKTRTHNQHFSLFVSKSHNSHPLSLSNCSNCFLVLLLSFPALGRWRESSEEKLGISQKLVSFCIPLFVVGVNGVRSPHVLSLVPHCTFVPHTINMKGKEREGVARTLIRFTSFTHHHSHWHVRPCTGCARTPRCVSLTPTLLLTGLQGATRKRKEPMHPACYDGA